MGYSRREKEEKRKSRSPINYIKLIILNKPRSNLVRRVFICRVRPGGELYSILGVTCNVMILRIVLVYEKFLCNRPRF